MKFCANLIFVAVIMVSNTMGWFMPHPDMLNLKDEPKPIIRITNPRSTLPIQPQAQPLTVEENAAANRWMLLGQRPVIDDISYSIQNIDDQPRSFVDKSELEKLMNDGKFNPNFFHFRVTRSAASKTAGSSD